MGVERGWGVFLVVYEYKGGGVGGMRGMVGRVVMWKRKGLVGGDL